MNLNTLKVVVGAADNDNIIREFANLVENMF